MHSLFRPINPSLGLENLCESNYRKLLQLIPELRSLDQPAIGRTPRHPALFLEILDRNPYTLTIELSHRFNQPISENLLPAVQIRVYLDAQLAEVIRDHDRPAASHAHPDPAQSAAIRDYKWRLNYFLQKWLDHCLNSEYRFACEEDCAA